MFSGYYAKKIYIAIDKTAKQLKTSNNIKIFNRLKQFNDIVIIVVKYTDETSEKFYVDWKDSRECGEENLFQRHYEKDDCSIIEIESLFN